MAFFRSHGAMVFLYTVPVILGALEIAGYVAEPESTSADSSGLTPSFRLIAEAYPDSPEAELVRGVDAKYLRFDLIEARDHFEQAIETGIKGHALLFYEYALCLHLMGAEQSAIDQAVDAWQRNDPASPLPDPRTMKQQFPMWQRAADPITLALGRSGRHFAVAPSSGEVSCFDLLRAHRYSVPHSGLDHLLEFSHDGRLLVAADSKGGVLFLNTEDGTVEAPKSSRQQSVLSAAFSEDDGLCATADVGGSIRIWDTLTLTVNAELSGHSRGVAALAFVDDSRRLVSGDWDGTIRVWDLSMPGQASTVLDSGESAVAALDVLPDSSLLFSASRDSLLRIHDLESGSVLKELDGHTAPVACVAVSSNGKLLASGSADRTVRFWDIASGKQIGQKNLPAPDGVCSVVFAPGGGLLIAADFNGSIHQLAVPSGQ